MSSTPAIAPSLGVGERLFQIAMRILAFGALLGLIAYLFLGRELRNDELGIFLWPLTALYLLSLFYVANFLVFTSVKSRLRYVVIPLWCLTMMLMTGGLVSLAFTGEEINVEPSAAPEPPPAAAVLESSETMNPKPESEAPADGGGR